jgi:hypothetical protein
LCLIIVIIIYLFCYFCIFPFLALGIFLLFLFGSFENSLTPSTLGVTKWFLSLLFFCWVWIGYLVFLLFGSIENIVALKELSVIGKASSV